MGRNRAMVVTTVRMIPVKVEAARVLRLVTVVKVVRVGIG
jgi:hypothetical protein